MQFKDADGIGASRLGFALLTLCAVTHDQLRCQE
jgi:hypothetical protein